jgi:hypothetical protein
MSKEIKINLPCSNVQEKLERDTKRLADKLREVAALAKELEMEGTSLYFSSIADQMEIVAKEPLPSLVDLTGLKD